MIDNLISGILVFTRLKLSVSFVDGKSGIETPQVSGAE